MNKNVIKCYSAWKNRNAVGLYRFSGKLFENPIVRESIFAKLLVYSFLEITAECRADYSMKLINSYKHFKKICGKTGFTPIKYPEFRDIMLAEKNNNIFIKNGHEHHLSGMKTICPDGSHISSYGLFYSNVFTSYHYNIKRPSGIVLFKWGEFKNAQLDLSTGEITYEQDTISDSDT